MDGGVCPVECAIDEEYSTKYNPPYVGVPAPAYLEDDPWFGPAPVRETATGLHAADYAY